MIFAVYSTEGTDVGFAQSGESWIVQSSSGKRESLSHAEMVKRLAALLRKGYVKNNSVVFWDKRACSFTHLHPDIASGGAQWVIAAEPPDLAQGIRDVTQRMLACTGVDIPLPVEVKAWAIRQEENERLLVAFQDHPGWSLLVGQTAMEKGWLLRAQPSLGAIPFSPPSKCPEEWDNWLASSFPDEDVPSVRKQLGLSLVAALKPSSHLPLAGTEGLLII